MFQAPANNTVNALPVVNVGRVNRWLKGGLDYALTIPTLILIAPLLLVIALLIKLESGGPVLYSRRV
ncbi:MAG: sugar transferase, partial [Anaerolineae bacterium]|nr:sugar transferase [Anaerolineae bacterium]